MFYQLLANSFISASTILLVALGFAIIYRCGRFFNFSLGVIVTLGAYLTFAFQKFSATALIWSILASIMGIAIMGVVIELSVYKQLRIKRADPLVLFLASLGVYVTLQNLISLIFGDDTKSIRSGIVTDGTKILVASITPIQLVTIGTSALLAISTAIYLKRTRAGLALIAVANDPELANVIGLESDRIYLWATVLGSSLAGVAGILIALDTDMTPTMGLQALMMGIVAVIIGGVNSIPGIVLGALLLGMARHFGVWEIGSQWQDAITFLILLIFLLFRPQGFLGKKMKKATV